MAGLFGGLFGGGKLPMFMPQDSSQSAGAAGPGVPSGMFGSIQPQTWQDKLYVLGAALKDASPTGQGGNLQNAMAQAMQMRMWRQQQGLMSDALGIGDGSQPAMPAQTVPNSPMGDMSAQPPATGGAPPTPQAPQLSVPTGGGVSRQRRALAATALLGGHPDQAASILGIVPKYTADRLSGALYDENTGTFNGQAADRSEYVNNQLVHPYAKDAPRFVGSPPVTGAVPRYDPDTGQIAGWRMPDGSIQAIQQTSAAQASGPAQYDTTTINTPQGPRTVRKSDLGQVLGGAQPGVPTVQGPGSGPAPAAPTAMPTGPVADMVRAEARAQGVPEDLALAVLGKESGGQHYTRDGKVITSPKGAIGAMQLMPTTAQSLGVDPYDPQQNVRGGVAYLGRMLNQFKDPRLALAAYNAGPGAVQRYGGVPPYAETQAYVGDVPATGGAQGVGVTAPTDISRTAAQAQVADDIEAAQQARHLANQAHRFMGVIGNTATGPGYGDFDIGHIDLGSPGQTWKNLTAVLPGPLGGNGQAARDAEAINRANMINSQTWAEMKQKGAGAVRGYEAQGQSGVAGDGWKKAFPHVTNWPAANADAERSLEEDAAMRERMVAGEQAWMTSHGGSLDGFREAWIKSGEGKVASRPLGGAPAQGTQRASPPMKGQSGGPVRVSSPQEAMALPSGTRFVTPDGRVKVRP